MPFLLDSVWSPSETVLGSVNTTLHEDKGMVLQQIWFKKLCKSQALTQTWSYLHSSRASCPILSLLTPSEAPQSHKGLAVSASSHITRAAFWLQKCLIMLTWQQVVHLQAQVFMSLSCEGLASEGIFTGPVSRRDLLSSVCDGDTFSLQSQRSARQKKCILYKLAHVYIETR